jgi:hypothetical protein
VCVIDRVFNKNKPLNGTVSVNAFIGIRKLEEGV